METILKTKSLTKSYGKNRGIVDVNLEIKKGEIYGFIGPNGAGKSTFIRTILNFFYPTSGEIELFGKDIIRHNKLLKEKIGYVPSEVNYYEDVKVGELLDYSDSFYKNIDYEYKNSLIELLSIDINKKIRELSLGNKKKVAIAQCLISKPEFIILDEPTSGLDPLLQKKLFNLLTKEKERGGTILLSSHNLTEVESLCDRVAIIKEGRIIEILELDKEIEKFGLIIDLIGDIPKDTIDSISEEIIVEKEKYFKFVYKKDINTLISELSKHNIEGLEIREQTLEDTFIEYYKEG